MIAQEHAPSYQQQHNPTSSQALHPCPAAVLQTRAPPLGQRRGEMGMAGEAGTGEARARRRMEERRAERLRRNVGRGGLTYSMDNDAGRAVTLARCEKRMRE